MFFFLRAGKVVLNMYIKSYVSLSFCLRNRFCFLKFGYSKLFFKCENLEVLAGCVAILKIWVKTPMLLSYCLASFVEHGYLNKDLETSIFSCHRARVALSKWKKV